MLDFLIIREEVAAKGTVGPDLGLLDVAVRAIEN
jgi:hypothetical protein